jgi:L-threonylcarbamoyladenylate synthase
MWFSLPAALGALAHLGPRTRGLAELLLPGPVLLVVQGREGSSVGVRVPALGEALAPLGRVRAAVLQTSANLTGGPDPRALEDVPPELRDGADLVLDGGVLPGRPSTVVDLTRYEDAGEWQILREGALSGSGVEAAIAASSAGR